MTGARGCALAAMLAVLAMACRQQAAREPAGPHLEARWTGVDTASFSAPATAERCDSLDLLEIRAASGDTGLALAIYRHGAAGQGTYRIRPPEPAKTDTPAAAVALRWFSRMAVRGFRSDTGTLTLRRAPDGTLSGRFTAGLSPAAGAGALVVTGSFERLRVRPAVRGCTTRTSAPDSSGDVD
jgi:hypothetical protein